MGMRPIGIALLVLAGCGGASTASSGVDVLPTKERVVATVAAPRQDAAAECSLAWEPHSLGASVVSIPAETAAAMMAPVMTALCACTEPGSRHAVVIDFEPGRGHVAVHDSEADAALDRCLEPRLGDGLYPPFELGSDCIDCGPKRYGVFGGPPPEPPRGARIHMPLQVDRSAER